MIERTGFQPFSSRIRTNHKSGKTDNDHVGSGVNHTSDLDSGDTFKLGENKDNPTVDFDEQNLACNDKIGESSAGRTEETLDGIISSGSAYLDFKKRCEAKNSTY